MKRFLSSILSSAIIATFVLASVASPADAKACRDAKGKFAKCPPAMSAMGVGPKKRCRDTKGHFVKCGSMMMAKKHK